MLVPACGNGRARAERPRARRSPLEGGAYPRARRSPLEVSIHPRTGRSPLEGGACPRARRSLLEGIFEWAALVGRGGHRGVGRASCVFKKSALSFGLFSGFKWGFPGCLRGPQGCPRQPRRLSQARRRRRVLSTYLAFSRMVGPGIGDGRFWSYSGGYSCTTSAECLNL
jgi:hypothetical protein